MSDMQKKVLKLIPIDSLSVVTDDFKNIPLYKVIEPGVLEISSGTRVDRDDVFVFDVTHTSQEFQKRYSENIVEYEAVISLDRETLKTKNKL